MTSGSRRRSEGCPWPLRQQARLQKEASGGCALGRRARVSPEGPSRSLGLLTCQPRREDAPGHCDPVLRHLGPVAGGPPALHGEADVCGPAGREFMDAEDWSRRTQRQQGQRQTKTAQLCNQEPWPWGARSSEGAPTWVTFQPLPSLRRTPTPRPQQERPPTVRTQALTQPPWPHRGQRQLLQSGLWP